MFLDQDQMYLRMCNVNKEIWFLGQFTRRSFSLISIFASISHINYLPPLNETNLRDVHNLQNARKKYPYLFLPTNWKPCVRILNHDIAHARVCATSQTVVARDEICLVEIFPPSPGVTRANYADAALRFERATLVSIISSLWNYQNQPPLSCHNFHLVARHGADRRDVGPDIGRCTGRCIFHLDFSQPRERKKQRGL